MGKKVCTVLAVFISIIYFLVLQIVVLLNFASSFLNGETYANILKNEEFKTIKLSELNIEELTDDYGVDATVEDVLIDALVENGLKIEVAKEFVNNDLVIDLDITSPLRTVKDLDDMVEKKLNTDYELIFSVTDARRNPYFNMVMKTQYGYDRVIRSNFNTRQEAPEIYDMNASIYVYSREFLHRKVGLFEGKCGIHKMFDTGVLDLDHENDLFLMEVIAKYLFENNEEFGEVYHNI